MLIAGVAVSESDVDTYGHLEREDLVQGMRRAGERWSASAEITREMSDLRKSHEKCPFSGTS